jgi:hypothetical protein
MASLVLLFHKAADAKNAARVHHDACPMINTAKPKGRGVVVACEATKEAIDDLNERGFPVKACKCVKDPVMLTIVNHEQIVHAEAEAARHLGNYREEIARGAEKTAEKSLNQAQKWLDRANDLRGQGST